jgi:hypothetical protein
MYTSAHSRTPSSDPSGGRTMMLPRFPSSDGDGGGDMPAGVGPFAIREGPEFGRMEGDVRGNGLGDERNRQRRSDAHLEEYETRHVPIRWVDAGPRR